MCVNVWVEKINIKNREIERKNDPFARCSFRERREREREREREEREKREREERKREKRKREKKCK